MRKEKLKVVPKVWGEELWLVNSDKYCGKLLTVNKGAESSYHYHREKEETFYCLYGKVSLTIEGKDYTLTPHSCPMTIEPNEKHSFVGLVESVILEVSTHHDNSDVVRLTESKSGVVSKDKI